LVVVNGEIQRGLGKEEIPKKLRTRERPTAARTRRRQIKTSDRIRAWTQLDMNILSVSWEPPVDRSAPWTFYNLVVKGVDAFYLQHPNPAFRFVNPAFDSENL
jgi:hypothetical protein